jgi:hypothetical protein
MKDSILALMTLSVYVTFVNNSMPYHLLSSSHMMKNDMKRRLDPCLLLPGKELYVEAIHPIQSVFSQLFWSEGL